MSRESRIRLKVERAKRHVAEFERELRAFFDTNPYKVGAKRDPQTRKWVYYVAGADPIPECLPLIAGDAIQNLMTALDHLAYQIVCSDTGDRPPKPRRIYFPIANDASEYEARKRGKMDGALQETFDAIDALKPYKGGNDLLWVLYRLNVIEKHRLLLTIGAQAAGVNFAQYMARSPALPREAVSRFESMSFFLKSTDRGFPLKEGFELFIGTADDEPNPKQQFRFDVAFGEPGIIEGEPVLEAIRQLTALVEGIITALAPRLR